MKVVLARASGVNSASGTGPAAGPIFSAYLSLFIVTKE